jgi:hypothetical protein
MCFFTYFDSIYHQWQIMDSVSTGSKEVETSCGHHIHDGLSVNWAHGVQSIYIDLCYLFWHSAGKQHICAFLLISICYFTNDKMMAKVSCRSKQQKNSGGHCSKRFFGEWAHIIWSILTMKYDQYRPVSPFYILLVTRNVLLHSFLLFISPMTNDGVSVNQ